MENHLYNFKKDGYVLIKNFLSKEMADFFYYYIKMEAGKRNFLDEINYFRDKESFIYREFGEFTDKQCPGAFSRYGDLVFDSLLTYKIDEVKSATGLELAPNYTYHRLYVTDQVLHPHKDRLSCNISATICMGYDNRNLDYEYNWPIYMEEKPVYMKPGDLVVYRGCDLNHYRDSFLGLNHAQVFLHWHDVNDPMFKNKKPFDGRPILGLGPLFEELKDKSNQFRDE